MEYYQSATPAHLARFSPCMIILFGLWSMSSAIGQAQQPEFDTDPKLAANAVQRISEHVYAISEVGKIAKGSKLYLGTTHFHPEHAAGEAGFPAGTILIRSKIQQQELEEDQGRLVALFARNPDFALYLQGVSFRRPDILFDKGYRLDLGGVHVRLMWLGPAHTRGDQEFFIEEDRALFTGDLAMSNIRPRNYAQGSSWEIWITILDELAALRPVHVLPDHGAFGDATLIDDQRRYLSHLMSVGAGPNRR